MWVVVPARPSTLPNWRGVKGGPYWTHYPYGYSDAKAKTVTGAQCVCCHTFISLKDVRLQAAVHLHLKGRAAVLCCLKYK